MRTAEMRAGAPCEVEREARAQECCLMMKKMMPAADPLARVPSRLVALDGAWIATR